MPQRLKVLMSAYACEPHRGSEPEAGWQWALHMAQYHDVTVVTRANNQAAIDAELARRQGPCPRMIYYDLPAWLLRLKKRGLPVFVYYVLWQVGVRFSLHRRLTRFDLVHHTTFNAFQWPGVWWFCPVPVLLGPLGGGQICPWRYLPLFGRHLPAELLRSAWVWLSWLNPVHWANCAAAGWLLVANRDTLRRIPGCYRKKTELMLDVGREAQPPPSLLEPQPSAEVQVIWVGTLQERKAAPLALRAFAAALRRCPSLRLTIVGGGPQAEHLKTLAARLGVTDRVKWHGRQPHRAVQELVARHDFLLFTSIRDTSGNVVLEALHAGRPVITLNHQGAAEMATTENALRVPVASISGTVNNLADAILRLAQDVELRQRLGRAGYAHVEANHLWADKAAIADRIYKDLAAAASWSRGTP